MSKKFNAKTVQTAFVSSIDARVKYAQDKGILNQVKNLTAEKKFFASDSMIRAIEELHAMQCDVSMLAKRIAHTDDEVKSKQVPETEFVAVYALQKVRKAIFAIAQSVRTAFDGYSNSIVANLTAHEKISNANMQRSICKKIEFSETEQVIALRRLHDCAPSTASTQASSTREMLRLLDVCDVHKSAKGDSISYKDNAIAARVKTMFATATA